MLFTTILIGPTRLLSDFSLLMIVNLIYHKTSTRGITNTNSFVMSFSFYQTNTILGANTLMVLLLPDGELQRCRTLQFLEESSRHCPTTNHTESITRPGRAAHSSCPVRHLSLDGCQMALTQLGWRQATSLLLDMFLSC